MQKRASCNIHIISVLQAGVFFTLRSSDQCHQTLTSLRQVQDIGFVSRRLHPSGSCGRNSAIVRSHCQGSECAAPWQCHKPGWALQQPHSSQWSRTAGCCSSCFERSFGASWQYAPPAECVPPHFEHCCGCQCIFSVLRVASGW